MTVPAGYILVNQHHYDFLTAHCARCPQFQSQHGSYDISREEHPAHPSETVHKKRRRQPTPSSVCPVAPLQPQSNDWQIVSDREESEPFQSRTYDTAKELSRPSHVSQKTPSNLRISELIEPQSVSQVLQLSESNYPQYNLHLLSPPVSQLPICSCTTAVRSLVPCSTQPISQKETYEVYNIQSFQSMYDTPGSEFCHYSLDPKQNRLRHKRNSKHWSSRKNDKTNVDGGTEGRPLGSSEKLPTDLLLSLVFSLGPISEQVLSRGLLLQSRWDSNGNAYTLSLKDGCTDPEFLQLFSSSSRLQETIRSGLRHGLLIFADSTHTLLEVSADVRQELSNSKRAQASNILGLVFITYIFPRDQGLDSS